MSLLADNPTWTIADRIKRARLLAGLDQDDVAEACGVARPTVSAWETGKTEPKFSSLVRVARLTGQPLEWFAAAVNAETASTEVEAVSSLSQHSVRPKGLEPLTFWLGVSEDALDAEYQLLLIAEAVQL